MDVSCRFCHARNDGDARFCSSCGSALRNPCRFCGAMPPVTAEACPACGRRLGFGPDLAERKIATVLFADLAGSTAAAERLDVEIHQALMSAYFDAMRGEVEDLGGTVEQFVGDAVLAVFGVPVAREDDADRALVAARRMLARLQRLNTEVFSRHGLEFGLRIGVNTGEVVTPGEGDLGKMAGDALNVGARLAQRAEVGSVLVSGPTASASRRFDFRPVGSLELRGRSEPVPAFELIGETSAGRSGTVGRAPLVGREHELGVLASLWERVCAEGRPHLVTIYGTAGVGKSRIAEEFAQGQVGPAGATLLFGRCRPYGEDATYGALTEIGIALAGVEEGDGAEAVVAKIETLVAGLGSGDPPEGALEALLHASGIGSPGSRLAELPARQVRAAIRGAWCWVLDSLAERQPVLVRVEDIHWADPALLDLLDDLAGRIAGPVMFVCPARPTLLDRQPNWGSGRHGFSTLTLAPLSAEEARRLIEWLLGTREPPEQVVGPVIDRADGNPFFMEEILRGMVDQGLIVRSSVEGGWRLAGDVGTVHIPTTVQAVIAARIDLLELPHKRVLQCAAVVGRTFWNGAIATLLAIDRSEVDALLDDLERRELVVAGSDSVLSGERESRFRHGLVRDVAYDSLARRERSVLHQAVADWLAEAAAGSREIIGLQAHHLARAYDGVRDRPGTEEDADKLQQRALSALLAASSFALQRAALGQAKYFAAEAGRVAITPVDRSLAAEALGEAYFYGYEGDRAWRALRDAIQFRLDEGEGPDPEVARLCARALQLPVRWPGAMRSTPDEMLASRYLHLGMSHARPDSEESVRLLTIQGLWQHAYPRSEAPADYLVDPQESLRSAEQAVRMAAAMQRPDLESAALDAVAGCYIPRGLYSVAATSTERRLELIGDLHDLWEIGDTYAMQGWVAYHLGEYRTAFRRSDEGYHRTVSEAPSLALQCLRWRALARFRLGDWTGVRVDLALARDLLGDIRDDPPNYVSPMFGAAALVHEYRGEHAAADAILEVLVAHYERLAEPDRDRLPLSQWAEFVAPILARRGRHREAIRLLDGTSWRRGSRQGALVEAGLEVAAEAADWERVEELSDEARSLAEQGGLRSLGPAADALEGHAARAAEEYDFAIASMGRAAQGFGRIGAVWDEARARLTLALILDEAGFDRRAAEELRRCLRPLEEMGARREVDAGRELAAVLL